MIVIIPLGGIGSRFKKFNYKNPKPLINVMGKPILYWLLDNLNFKNIKKIIIPYNPELEKYNFESRLLKDYTNLNFHFINLKNNTKGATESIYKGLENLNISDSPILCLDGDNFYNCDIISLWKGKNNIFIFEDKSKNPIYSYVKINNEKKITEIIEKEKISDYACTGAYGFNSWKKLKNYCKFVIDNNIKQKNEFYLSNVIKEIIKKEDFFIKKINKEDYICLGTTLQVRLFCNNFPKINAKNNKNMIPLKRYCFDLDNTLVTFPIIPGDYSTVQPIKKNIDYLKYLKKLGQTIIIYTARKMKTFKGSTGKVLANIGIQTFKTLEEFNIPYDEIYFGKPYADYYIDDLAISSYENLEKELGFYKSFIEPRSFNNLEFSSIETVEKKSNDLSGEIYYYNNIPNNIKDLFPIIIDYNSNYTSYKIEKINGIPISKLFLSEELTEDLLKHILNSINRIHNSNNKINNDINIYKNYLEKLIYRYESYDYSVYKNSNLIFIELKKYFENYEKNDLGQKKIIHGDCVFTNILLNNYSKLKFIDMRGKQGNINSIYGDLFYDYAKIYQSLIGYDEILDNTKVNIDYKNKLITVFKNYFCEKYGKEDFIKIKMICKLLLFTLLPLHKNEIKCKKYYDLINNF